MLKVFEMFAGYGGASFALKKACIEFECIGYSEIDKYACKVYEMNHGNIPNFGDATLLNPLDIPDFDLLTGGFPCQPFSVAGLGKGCMDSRGTLFESILNVLKVKQPKYFLLENVKGLLSKKHSEYFDYIINSLGEIGYNTHAMLLNSKDYGVPQNRERVWICGFRQDIDAPMFIKPQPEPLRLNLSDILEPVVDEKYFVKQEVAVKLLQSFKNPDVSYCIDANYYKGTSIENYLDKKRRQLVMVKPCVSPERLNKTQNGRRIKDDGEESFTLTAYDRHGVMIVLNEPTHSNDRVYDTDGISPTLNTMQGGRRQPLIVENWWIRRLTPTECFRLQGFLFDEIILDGISDTQKYKMAGNGWDINIASKVLSMLLVKEIKK